MQLRVIQAGALAPLRSQAIYHGVAQAMAEGDGAVLILCHPTAPYLSIGMHQDAQLELDLRRCAARNLPVIPRQVGGGCVLLDAQQLFFQFVLPKAQAPRSPEQLYPWLLAPVCRTYQQLGLNAQRVGLNDLQVDGRKITGTGAGSIGNATVLVGSIINDFDTATMAQVIQAPSNDYRQCFANELRRRMTSLREQLGAPLPHAQITAQLIQSMQTAWNAQLIDDDLTTKELDAIAEMEAELLEHDQWQNSKKLVPHGIKICAQTYLTERYTRCGDDELRCLLVQQQQRVQHWQLFVNDQAQTALPALHHCPLTEEALTREFIGQNWPTEKIDAVVTLLTQSRIDQAI